MKSDEGQEAKCEVQRSEISDPSSPVASGGEQIDRKNLDKLEGNKTEKIDVELTNPKNDVLKWGAERYLENTRFFLDLGVKGVGLFYAILGGVLSIYFARNTDNGEVLKFFLLVPLVISLSLGVVYLIGARAWSLIAKKLNEISDELNLGAIPNLFFITWLLIALGALFIVTGVALGLLYISVK